MSSSDTLLEILKIIATCSIIFVWFVRYKNIKIEFQKYGFPTWFRDFVGILKISSIAMLHYSNTSIVYTGIITILFLMLGAVLTHIIFKDSFRETIASVGMLLASIIMLILI